MNVDRDRNMALKPSYNDKLYLPGLSNTEILILALEASQKLEWNIEEVTPEGIRFEVPFSIRSHGEAITFTIEKGSDGEVSVRSQSSSVQFVDYGKNRKNIQKLRETMEEIKASLTPEELAQRAKDFEEEFNRPLTEEEKAYIEEEKKRNSFLSFFIPRKGFIATPILIDINILVFIVMIASGVGIMSPSTLSLLKWGADFGPLTLTGDWWRAVTCNFIHIGAFHLLMNMYAFMYVGLLLEDLIGSRRMFMSYLLTGLCSAVFSLYMHGETISAGASGAIFGLYGIFLAFLFFHRIAKEQRKALLTSILIFVGYNLVYGMKAGIDNAAHIGGLLSGFLLGIIYVCSYKFEKADAQRTVSILGELGIFCIFLFSFLMLCKNVPPLYQDIRGEWESGIVEAYLNGELEEENENGNQAGRKTANSSSTSQYPPYVPVGNNDTWLSYYDAETNFSCQYPTNWRKITGAKGLTPSAEPPLLRLVNGANQLTVTALTYDTQKEFEHIKKLSLTLPRNAQGEPAEDYKQSNVNINGLSMTRTTNPLHIGAPDEPGEDIQQIVLHYFQESKKRTFTIVMLVYDEEAETDLNAITSSIQITQ
jgi:rhomboid protease GluP